MTEWKWIAAAALALLMPGSAEAATESNFNLNSTGDLVELCSATPDNGIGTAALNFCEGYIQGSRHGRDAEHGYVSWPEAVLPAQSTTHALSVDERVCQLGTSGAGSDGPITERRAVSIFERALSVPALSLNPQCRRTTPLRGIG
jgi:hypothetical protein